MAQDPADVPALHRVEAYIGKRLEEQPLSSLGMAHMCTTLHAYVPPIRCVRPICMGMHRFANGKT